MRLVILAPIAWLIKHVLTLSSRKHLVCLLYKITTSDNNSSGLLNGFDGNIRRCKEETTNIRQALKRLDFKIDFDLQTFWICRTPTDWSLAFMN